MSKDDDEYQMTDTDLGILEGTIGGFVEIAIPNKGDETSFSFGNHRFHVKNVGTFDYSD